jgi:hypothetical protein
MLEHSVKLCPYRLCGGVAACLVVACVLCVVQNETEYSIFRVCVCGLNYPAYKAHEPFCIFICDLTGSTILFSPTLSYKRHDFRKEYY